MVGHQAPIPKASTHPYLLEILKRVLDPYS